MIKFHLFRYVLILGLLVFLYSCDEEPRPNIKIKKISIKNVGDFAYQDSLTFATVDTLQYEIKIITDSEDAEIYYTVSNNNFSKQRNEWILIDSNISQIQFYAEKQGFNKSDIKALDFGYGNDSLIDKVILYPNPFDSLVNIELNSKTRGELFYKIYSITGELLEKHNDFLSQDLFQTNVNLKNLGSGLYVIKFEYGNTTFTSKLIRK